MRNSMKALLAASAGAAAAFAIAHANPEAEKAAIRAMFEEAIASMNACKTDDIGKNDAEGRTTYYPDSAEPHVETAETRQMAVDFCAKGGKHELQSQIRDIILLGDVAVAHGSGHYKRTEPDGTVSIDTDYTYTDVLVKKDGRWKIRHGHIGVVLPEEPAGEAQE
ncbi:YybH family protein [Amphiplicatus metriothermophilus]|uniref:Ketosteroid isomerase homolog n=1 Tax=Amphiplicatus metriothermophilus TaxID=1519374 RepID=A0A239PUA7_9PROT|nr:DUF4440 domain-containing protein [Amphiplicatus metriothermophilus]MBB5519481.1 ketosteroid isomerase-like protein [Amphiplicatus metriothermophilus]SNT73708.1 Ketosteroid isomerase homolog [Amphiplicatus metriothermophilus]